jgi:hypothetical protein
MLDQCKEGVCLHVRGDLWDKAILLRLLYKELGVSKLSNRKLIE